MKKGQTPAARPNPNSLNQYIPSRPLRCRARPPAESGRGLVEFWFAWLLVDLVGVPLNFANGYAFSGFVYVIYGALVLWGMRDWWLRSRTAPALEGATA